MNSLEILQKLAKIGKILSKIAYIFALVGGGGCLIAAVLLPLGAGEWLKLGGVTIQGILSRGIGIPQAWMTVAGGAIACGGQVVLAKNAIDYFTHELEAGTPFTLAGAKELQQLGILTIWVPLACAIPVGVLRVVAEQVLNTELQVSLGIDGSVTLGIVFLIVSLLCRCGAELSEKA